MNRSARSDNERFQSGANKYAAYLDTPEGRLRSDLAFANLQDFISLPTVNGSLHALDIGCGTGATAIRLARLGMHVTLLDSSPAILDIAKRAVLEAGVAGQVVVQYGDARQLTDLFQAASFDVILCHNVLEYLDEPSAVLCNAALMLRDASSVISVLVRNRAGEVFKAAILAGDLATAEHNLTAEVGQESLYGESVRLFTGEGMQSMLAMASLETIAERGIRVVSDYLPPSVPTNDEYEQIFELERKLGRRPEFAAVARYRQCMVRRASQVTKAVL